MNFKELQNNFKIRYNTKSSPQCVFTGYPLFLLGDITYNCENYALITSLSSGTALAFNISSSNTFSVQKTTDNFLYTCNSNELSDYHQENYAKEIFNLISPLYRDLNISGLNMLFSYDINQQFFQIHSAPILSALSCFMTEKKTSSQLIHVLQTLKFPPKNYASLLSSIDSIKNSCVLIDGNVYNYNHFLFPMSDKKIIIIKNEEKNQHISLNMNKAYSSYMKYTAINNSLPSLESDISTIPLQSKEIRLLSFLLNEKKRINKYPYIKTLADLCNIISESSHELLSLTSSSNIQILADVISETKIPLTFRPLLDESAFYCIVYNDDVDSINKLCEKNYEKKAGYKPTFYICDSKTGGLNFGIIH